MHRPVPTLEQVQDAAEAFRSLVRTSLANERLLELPSGRDVALAAEEQAQVRRVLDEGTIAGPELDRKLARYFDVDWVVTAQDQMREARAALRERLWDDLGRLDHANVDPFIREVARYRGYRIDPESVVYRQLGHLLLKGWTQELDEADARFMDPGTLLEDQDSALAGWSSRPGSLQSTPPALATKAQTFETPVDDIRQLFERYLDERFSRASASSLLERRTILQYVEVGGLKTVGQYRKADIPLDRNGRRSEAAGKRFRKFLTRLGSKEAGMRGGMHRFRHTVIEKLRKAGNSDYEIALIVGHETDAAATTAGYGSSRQILVVQRRSVLESLAYAGLDFTTSG